MFYAKARFFIETRAIAREGAGTHPICPTRSIYRAHSTWNHDGESEDSDDDSELDAVAEELESNWDDVIAHD